MPWLKVDDALTEHPKYTRYDADYDVCLSTWLQLASYCARNLTDGVIPALVERRHDSRIISLLLLPFNDGHGPLERDEDGQLRVHDYLDYNPTKTQVLAERAATAERVRRWRDAHRSGGGNGVTNGTSTASPVPYPIETDESKGDSSVSRARHTHQRRGDVSVVSAEYERLTGCTSPGTTLVALCADHPTERCVEAIGRGVRAGKTSMSYIAGIARGLAAEGWTPPPTLTAVPDPFFGLCGEEAQA